MRACLFTTTLIAATFASACTAPSGELALKSATFHTPGAPPPAAGTMFFFPERIPLERGGFVNAERGMYFAPVNRSVSDSAVIGIEVYRFPASPNAEPGTPPVFFLHGGPSFQGLERALELPRTFEQRWLPLTNVSDVVVVGQRGIGSSKPTTTIDVTTPSTQSDQSNDEGEDAAQFQRVLAIERSFWEEAGLDLAGFTVLEAAEDVNEVRRALGYGKIIVWGGSFGSHWGMSLMRLHPEIVERAVLRGMEGPDHTYDNPGHLWNVYRRVAQEAEAAPELQGMVPNGGLIAAIEEIVANAAEQPFTVPVSDSEDGNQQEVLFDRESVKRVARGYSGSLATWPADVITMSRGDFSEAGRWLYEQSRGTERNFRTASYFMLDCGSGITPQRLAEQNADPAMALLWRMNWTYRVGCSAWSSDLGDSFRQNFETDIPTVIAHGTWDTSTPYENALELVPYFKNSTFIPVIRGPHGAIQAAMNASPEFRAGILHFAATGDASRLPDEVTMPPVQFSVPR